MEGCNDAFIGIMNSFFLGSPMLLSEMSAVVISKIRQRGQIYPAELRALLYDAGVERATIEKQLQELYRPRPRINDCSFDQHCIERMLTSYMSGRGDRNFQFNSNEN